MKLNIDVFKRGYVMAGHIFYGGIGISNGHWFIKLKPEIISNIRHILKKNNIEIVQTKFMDEFEQIVLNSKCDEINIFTITNYRYECKNELYTIFTSKKELPVFINSKYVRDFGIIELCKVNIGNIIFCNKNKTLFIAGAEFNNKAIIFSKLFEKGIK